MSALRFINETVVTDSVSFIDVNNVFSADFDIYKITYNGFKTVSSTNAQLEGRLLTPSGSVQTNTKFNTAHHNLKAETGFSETKETSGISLVSELFGGADANPESNGGVSYIFNPYNSDRYTYFLFQSANQVGGNHRGRKGISVYKEAERFTGFRIVCASANVNEGVVRTYGLRRVDS